MGHTRSAREIFARPLPDIALKLTSGEVVQGKGPP